MQLHPAWFVLVLPDDERAAPIAGRLAGASVLRHASGRPWLVHTYPADQVVTNSAGPNRLAALGFSSATPESLQRAADRLRGVGDADELAHRLAGSHVLAVSASDEIRAQGTATGVRRVFTALVDGCQLVCDCADVLGRFPMDETVVAIRMLREIPHPLGELPVWQGVRPVPARHYATVDAVGRRLRTVSWWRRPQPMLSRGEGAIRLGATLDEAVDVTPRSAGCEAVHLHTGVSPGRKSSSFCSIRLRYFPEFIPSAAAIPLIRRRKTPLNRTGLASPAGNSATLSPGEHPARGEHR